MTPTRFLRRLARQSLLCLWLLVIAAAQAEAAVTVAPATYLDAVLERTENALQNIAAAPRNATYFDDDRFHWMGQVFGALFQFIDTDRRLTRTQRDLLASTPCLHAATALLEAKTEQVRARLLRAEREKDVRRIILLAELLRFLDASERTLLRGGGDPLLVDQSWSRRWMFEPAPAEGYCCAPGADLCTVTSMASCAERRGRYSENPFQCRSAGCDLPADAPRACPFDSDFLPPSTAGYGCDVDAMNRLLERYFPDPSVAAEVLRKERDALLQVQRTAEAAYAQATAFAIAQAGIDALIRGEEPTVPDEAPIQRQHLRATGCEPQACLDGDPRACRELRGAVLVEKRGAFSLETDHLRLLQTFQDARLAQDQARPASEALQYRSTDGTAEAFFKHYGEQIFRNVSADQSRLLSRLFALGVDPQLSVNESILPFRLAVQRLARLIEDPEAAERLGGLRRFTRDFAFFLRRTCLDRPCNERLERVLKITFSDACFPYTSGRFQSVDERTACREEAELNTAPYVGN